MNFSGYEQMYRLTVIYLLTITYILFTVRFESTVVHFFLFRYWSIIQFNTGRFLKLAPQLQYIEWVFKKQNNIILGGAYAI
jgi:hypothetical protein